LFNAGSESPCGEERHSPQVLIIDVLTGKLKSELPPDFPILKFFVENVLKLPFLMFLYRDPTKRRKNIMVIYIYFLLVRK